MTIRRVTTLLTGSLVAGGGINQLYFDESTSAADAHSAVAAFWGGLDDYIHSSVSIAVQPLVDELNEATGAIIAQNSVETVNLVGQQTQDALPPQTQGLIQFRTATFIDGRQLRGRVYVPGMVEGNSTLGAPTSAMVTALQTIGSALIADASSTFLIWQRPRAEPPRAGSASAAASATGWNKWAVLRSRRD